MASQSENEQKHSTLQLCIHDQGGNAPERNRETGAIELDSTATTPQVAFHTAPETRYSLCLPEVVDSHGCENREKSASKSAHDRRLSKIMLFTILALFLAVAIGIGVGVGLTRKKSSISIAQQSTAQQVFPNHGTILEGSSLAVIASLKSPTRLFFQRRNGDIIQAVFQASVNKWNTQVVAGLSARNHTPISATISPWDGSLYLFYIRESGHVAMGSYETSQGRWSQGLISAVDGKDIDFTTTNANASSLSATSTLGPGNKTNISVLYEDLNGDMIMIRGTPSPVSFKWRDISPELRSAAQEYALLRSPFTSGSFMAGKSEIIVTKPKFDSNHNSYLKECIVTIYENETFTPGERVFMPGTDRFLANANDDGTYILSIDKPGGMISLSNIKTSRNWHDMVLRGQFPFSKAAALFFEWGGPLIVYHQTNNLSIAEQRWDWSLDDWINGTWIDYDD